MILANHGIISSSGASFDADALAFITAASITDNTQKTAINTLVTDLKLYNIWTKMKAIYPFVGGTASAHKFNLKDPRDSNAAFRLNFFGGWTHSSTGALPNGTTAYANTYLNPYVVFGNNQAILPIDSTHSLVHVSKYSRTNSITTAIKYDGVYSGSGIGERPMILGWDSNTRPNGLAAINGGVYSGSYAFVTLGNRSDGYHVINRNAFTLLKSFRNNTLISTNTTDIRSYNGGLQDNVNPNQVFFIGARNDSYDYNLRPFAYNNFETAFQSIGDGLSDTEVSNLYTAVQAFNTTLSRNI